VRRAVVETLRRAEPYAQSTVLLALRLLYGWQFAQTGWGKLSNLERTTGFFESLGLPAPAITAMLVGFTELLGGLLFALGIGSRYVATVLTSVMLTAYLTAHADDAFRSIEAFTEQAPYPFLVATLIVLVFGAGNISLDRWLDAGAGRAKSVGQENSHTPH